MRAGSSLRRRHRFIEEAKPHAAASRGHLVARALRDGGYRLAIGHALECGDGGVGVLRLERDVEDLFSVGETCQRPQARGAVLRVAAHGAERFRIVNEIDDRGPDVGRRAVTRDEDDFLRASEREQLPRRLERLVDGVGLGRHSGQTAHGFGADVFVGVSSRDFTQHGDVVDTRHRGAPHAGLRILPGHGMKGVAFIGAKLIDRGDAHRRVSVFPARLRTKLFEDAHLVYRESDPACAGSLNLNIQVQDVGPDRNP